MKRLIWIAAAGIALVGAGIAVAHGSFGKSVKQVSATFNTTTASNVRTTSCTASDGTYTTSSGRYTGAVASAEPTLNGNATIDATSVLNTTTGNGVVSGHIRIDASAGGHTDASFDAVYTNGQIAGLAEGHGGPGGNGLVANLSAAFSATGGFQGGKLGGGSGGGNAVLVSGGSCQPTPPPRPETVEAHGAITQVTSTSITVAGVTCTVPTNLQPAVASLHQNDRVVIRCTVAGGTNT